VTIDPSKDVQDYGPYKIVIREKDGKVYGIVWRGSEHLVQVWEATRALVAQALEREMASLASKRAKALGTAVPPDKRIEDAFSMLWNHLDVGPRRMLSALHQAEGREMTMHQLTDAAGYKGIGGVNMRLGIAGYLFWLECPRSDLQINDEGNPVPTSWFCLWDKDKHTWTMRPEVAAAMTSTNCLS